MRGDSDMAYVNIELPVTIPINVQKFIQERVEPLYLMDVHAMFRLPLPNQEIYAGLNFAIAQILSAVISGISVTLYEHAGEPGELFKRVIEEYFPWDQENCSVSPIGAANIIYDVFRNPLAHAAGLSIEWRGNNRYLVESSTVEKVKRRLTDNKTVGHTEEWLEKLERSLSRPNMGPTLVVEGNKKVLLIEGLYWCIRRMIQKLASDEERMAIANTFLRNYS